MCNLHYEKFADGTVKCIEDEIPFELPFGWGWTRIGNIASVKGGKRVPKGMTFSAEPTHHAYVRVTDMKNHTVNLSDLKYIDETVFAEIKNYTIAKNDLYITIAGTIGAVGEFPDELDGMNLTENAVKVSAIGINKSFLCFIMQTEFVQKQFKHKTYQVAMPKLGLERILTTLIPVCGIVTQQKICDAIQNSTKYIDIIGENYSGLSDTIAVIKSKILDLAIRGKLVPQNPDDEPASALLERIRAEKEVLIKQGKIKRDKKESIIFKGEDNSYYVLVDGIEQTIEDYMQYSLPKGWEWICLKDIATISSGKTPASEMLSEDGQIPYYKISDMNVEGNELYLDKTTNYLNVEYDGIVFNKGSFVFPKNGGAVLTNKKRILLHDSLVDLNTGVISFSPFINAEYAFLMFSFIDFSKLYKGSTIPTVDSHVISNLIFALPPLNEQQHIVQVVKKVFDQLDTITESLN